MSRPIVERYGLTFPVLSDAAGDVVRAFGVVHEAGNPIDGSDIARPATFLLDRDGRIVWRDLTENWRIRPRPSDLLARAQALPLRTRFCAAPRCHDKLLI